METVVSEAPIGADERVLTGDALSRFISRRIGPEESPHDAWQQSLREAAPGRPPRNAALPRAGFRPQPG